MGRPASLAKRVTYAEYRTWSGEERWELISGTPYAMSPAPSVAHQRLVRVLLRQIDAFFLEHPDRRCEILSAPLDVRLTAPGTPDEEIVDVVQPDLVVVCDPEKIDEVGVLGAPDWIIEVISPSTASRDNIQKLALYEKHGVRHYWLAHPLDRILTHYRLEQNGFYGRPTIFDMQGRQPSGVVDGLTIDWDAFEG